MIFTASFSFYFSASEQDGSEADDDDSFYIMEEGSADSSAMVLREGLRKKRKESQGYPKNALVDSDTEEVVEKEEYVKGKMKKQRRRSQGYAEGTGSSEDEPPGMAKINLEGFWEISVSTFDYVIL